MADNGAAQPQAPAVKMNVLNQFIRDMSFENILAQKGASGEVQPDVNVQVNLDAKKRATENQYEVAIKLQVTSTNKEGGENLFLLEVDYVGLFHIENVPEDQLHPFLLIECPRLLFPFLRRIVSDVTRDGGFPPLNLENIDFMALYRNELARRAQSEAAAAPAN
ncbi:protein-export chaperone SecB [Thalassovita mediterranea]|jgi:preprotein translocase subunit SecB|uniref:Protein-export protein SecB n=1 Tax=Thalassovita mediterranea TaxID=340021 RepID=A0A0P1HF46_9RHOB|nr:protein-export chaperone SecB [Thalassovita mediterranea]MCG7572702.1 protein-export chaperone SecB [Phaeobacter sp. CNT1-3]CUH85465.1 Protein-export protein SecB [Thalassovita mediterranea]SIS31727.1 protein translocase subunit secB [Thalassovita mediterranea]